MMLRPAMLLTRRSGHLARRISSCRIRGLPAAATDDRLTLAATGRFGSPHPVARQARSSSKRTRCAPRVLPVCARVAAGTFTQGPWNGAGHVNKGPDDDRDPKSAPCGSTEPSFALASQSLSAGKRCRTALTSSQLPTRQPGDPRLHGPLHMLMGRAVAARGLLGDLDDPLHAQARVVAPILGFHEARLH